MKILQCGIRPKLGSFNPTITEELRNTSTTGKLRSQRAHDGTVITQHMAGLQMVMEAMLGVHQLKACPTKITDSAWRASKRLKPRPHPSC